MSKKNAAKNFAAFLFENASENDIKKYIK